MPIRGFLVEKNKILAPKRKALTKGPIDFVQLEQRENNGLAFLKGFWATLPWVHTQSSMKIPEPIVQRSSWVTLPQVSMASP